MATIVKKIPSSGFQSLSTIANSSTRRVVVTGIGLVTCLGVGVQHVWSRLIQGHVGLSNLQDPVYITKKIPCRIAGLVPRGCKPGELNIDEYVSKSDQARMNLASCYALVAAEEALEQAQWKPKTDLERNRTGVAVGCGMVSLEDIVETGMALDSKGYSKVNPHFIPKILVNMPAGHISIKHGFTGVNHSVSTACTTGAHSIGDAFNFIKSGVQDVMVCGGTEASVNPVAMAGFARIRALALNFNDEPEKASRPFDVDRNGFVMSEGAGILVLEEMNHAISRGATILGEVLGYGLSADANHITAPATDGRGARQCMSAALEDSGLEPSDIGYINAHATSTPLGDAAESCAITKLFKEHRHSLCVSSSKGAVGHLLGAAGSVEAAFTLMACNTSIIPPTANCYTPDPDSDLDYVPLVAKDWKNISDSGRRCALTNSFGFGGTNATLCFSDFKHS
jgi:3-oxoacyl-[acyl-carrier-protein] synthase II